MFFLLSMTFPWNSSFFFLPYCFIYLGDIQLIFFSHCWIFFPFSSTPPPLTLDIFWREGVTEGAVSLSLLLENYGSRSGERIAVQNFWPVNSQGRIWWKELECWLILHCDGGIAATQNTAWQGRDFSCLCWNKAWCPFLPPSTTKGGWSS